MLFGYFTLFVALVISVVAEYYSIVGLTSIFAAAVIPVIVMGAALGVGKITAAIWLKINWHRASFAYKLYLVPAVAFLMVLTSMGIFGFLSKAHSDQSLVTGDVQSKIALYDEKIKIAKDNIDANRKALKQMDEAVDQVMGRSTSETGADKAISVRRAQQKERSRLLSEIQSEQKVISQLNEERAPIAAEVRKVEAEVGPIKYIAAMIYGDNTDANLLESAVRWVIILIVAVFDPLALMLILAGQQSIRWGKEKPKYEKDEGALTSEQIAQIAATAEAAKEPVETKETLFPDIDEGNKLISEIEKLEPELPEIVQDEQVHYSAQPITPLPEAPPAQDPYDISKLAYLNEPFAHFKDLKPMVYRPPVPKKPLDIKIVVMDQPDYDLQPEPEPVPELYAGNPDDFKEPWPEEEKARLVEVMQEFFDKNKEQKILAAGIDVVDRPGDYVTPPVAETAEIVKPAAAKVKEAAEPPAKAVIRVAETFDPKAKTADSGITADNDIAAATEVKAHFGITFPSAPDRGELFLRVDYLPSRLFKYNGSKWIEVDKTMTDSYVYNEEYIKFLIDEIAAARVDPEELSSSERDQIAEFLRNNEQSSNAS